MWPTWCYVLPMIIYAVVIGALAIGVWEAVWFVIHHWTWIWPHLTHFIHWFCLGT